MANRSEKYGQFDRSPELKPGDLQRGLGWLRTEAERGSPSARAVLAELGRLREQHERDLIHVREAHAARRLAEADARLKRPRTGRQGTP